MRTRVLLLALFAIPLSAILTQAALELSERSIEINQVDLTGALFQGPLYPQIDWSKLDLDNPKTVRVAHRAIVLENEFLRVTILPEMGRIYSLVSSLTGHEQLWTNPVARPIRAHNDTGWWHVFGGIEYVIPRGEHGTTWALKWDSKIVEDSPSRKAVRMRVTEPGTGLEQSLEVSIYPARALCETAVSVKNPSNTNVLFSHWMNPMLAPGGRNELTPKTEMIVPCTGMTVPERGFNNWILGARTQPWEQNPLRFVENWLAPGDLLAEKLTENFYGAFCHEENEGIARLFDRTITPGMDIWTWGFPPPAQRQREYTLGRNLGYIEMWGGTVKDYSDDARQSLAPGKSIAWKEHLFPFSGINGLSWADTNAAINFRWSRDQNEIALGICPVRTARFRVEVRHGTRKIFRERLNLSPRKVFNVQLPGAASAQDPPVLKWTVEDGPEVRIHAHEAQPLRWGFPFREKKTSPAAN